MITSTKIPRLFERVPPKWLYIAMFAVLMIAPHSCDMLSCHPSCATCSNSSVTGCLTCPPNKFLIPSNHTCVENCPSGYTGDIATKTCVAVTCHPSCATCSNSSETGCLTCPFYKYLLPLNHTCVSSCPSGYTGNFITKTCVAVTCHPSCATCSNSSANGCLTCPVNKFLLVSNHSCLESCPSGYTADLTTKTCVLITCHPSCATCSNSSETGCLTCPFYKYLLPLNHTCVSSCPSGYTGDFATKTCVAVTCHPSCATCSNSSANGCLTCPLYKFLLLSNHSCVSTCPSGYTGDIATKTCVLVTCHPSCATCSNSSETGCLTCPPYKFLIPSNHTCVSNCPSGYTGDYATKTCVAITCHPSCATCSNSSSNGCLTCPPYKFLIPSNHTCVSTCPSGYTGDIATKTCVAITCHPSCATCSNSSETGCLTCPFYKYLLPLNHTCVSSCPSGYTGDFATKTCVAITCHPSCATCSNSSATGCLTCPPYKFLIPLNHTCVSTCPSGYVGDYVTKTCVAITCHPSCATCSNSSATGCLTCPPYKFLIPSNHTCVSTCPSGYVGDYVTKTCVAITCHPSCATCSNSSATGCLTCPPYKFLIPSNHTCVSTCPSGYTGDYATKTCVAITCHPSCATCSNSSATGCLTCPPYKFLIPSNHTCVSTCPSGYVGDYVTKTCVLIPCHPSCATCSNSSATGCLTCPPYKFLIPSNHTCVSTCPIGYTGDLATKTCVIIPCHPSCATCSNSSSNGCLTCPPYKFLIPSNHTCVSICPYGYVGDYVTKTCVLIPCHPSCATCSNSSATGCLTCPLYKFLIPSNHSCVATCPVGYIANYTTKTCVPLPCHPSCATCSNSSANGCLTCPPNRLFLAFNNSCVKTCPPGWYASGNVCVACHSSCATCSNSSANGCLSCSGNRFLNPNNNKCVLNCPAGWYGSNNLCVACHSSCATCSNSTAKGCLTCPPNRFLLQSNHSCVKNCPVGYTENVFTRTCVLLVCHPSCATCSNSSATGCLTCPPYRFLIPSNHTCVSTCPPAWCGSGNVCVTCHPTCATCSNNLATGCLTCSGSRYLWSANHTCLSSCPAGYYGDSATHTCKPCDRSCYTCSNGSSNGCLSCSSPLYFLAANHSCTVYCPRGTIPNKATRVCDPIVSRCHPSCATCSGSGEDQCLTCASSFPVKCGGYCQVQCPGSWVRNQWVCHQCHASCRGCASGARNCLLCASGYTRVGTTGPCIPSQKSRRLRE